MFRTKRPTLQFTAVSAAEVGHDADALDYACDQLTFSVTLNLYLHRYMYNLV